MARAVLAIAAPAGTPNWLHGVGAVDQRLRVRRDRGVGDGRRWVACTHARGLRRGSGGATQGRDHA
eukprot:6375079-Lingulodinium_polyedra.AAC.1